MTRAPTDARDQRDLAVLAQRQDGLRAHEIARRLAIPEDVVETILAEDARAFPREPLRRRA